MLKNLNNQLNDVRKNYQDNFDSNEALIPEGFKVAYRSVLEEEKKSVQFTPHTTIITDKDSKKIYFPNQWFYIAGYITPYMIELFKYRELAIQCISKELPNNKSLEDQCKFLKDKNSPSREKIAKSLFMTSLPADYRGDEREQAAELLTRFVTDYNWWLGNKTISRGDFYVSPTLALSGVINASGEYIARLALLFKDNPDLLMKLNNSSDILVDGSVVSENSLTKNLPNINTPRLSGGINEIVYGAPGTGKSRYLENIYGTNSEITRVIFHPEYTTFDFIGSYKPITIYMSTEKEIHYADGAPFRKGEPLIDYGFVPGPFISILIEAWLHPDKMYTLIIEEINRANAAAVFGEIFQLLDREPGGESEYGITPSNELEIYLRSIPGMKEFLGEGLKIPSNLNLVATMNSADQGVSPMDSAFKRRWNFRYLRIDSNGAVHSNALISYAGYRVKWGNLISAINSKLVDLGFDEDRLIGTYFIKPGEVGNSKATDKLLLYLWDDVLRYRRNDFFDPLASTFSKLSELFDSEDVLGLFGSDYLTIDTAHEEVSRETDIEIPEDE